MAADIENVLKSQEEARYLSQALRQKITDKFHDLRSSEILYECLQRTLTESEVGGPTAIFP